MARRSTSKKPSGPPKFTGAERIIVLHGPELFLRREYMLQLRAAIEKHAGGEVDTIRFDGERAALADVFDELRSFGLMAQHKLVIVDDADEFAKKHREALQRYAESPVDIATLVLRAGKWYAGNLDKAIVKVGQIIKCEPQSRADVVKWATARCKNMYGVVIDPRAVEALISHLGADLGRVDSELSKLASGTAEGQSITLDMVEAMVGHASDEHAWMIQHAMLSGSAGDAITKLHELVDLGGQPEQLISYAAADLMRKLHHAAAMIEQGQNNNAICGKLKIFPFDRRDPFMRAARRIHRPLAAKMLRNVLNLDRRAKSGFGQTMPNIERFCVQFADSLR